MPSLITIFRDMPDPRSGNARRHSLLDILTIALVASVCGAESCVDFAGFGEDREPLLREFPSLEYGLPSRAGGSVLTRYCPGSARLTPARFAHAVRSHRAIQTSLRLPRST